MKTCIIAGCSHTAGSEIDGTEDSVYNRSMSFGNQLARKLGYYAVNIAITGSSNQGIARSLLEYFKKNTVEYDKTFVLIGWTDSTRIDLPIDWNGNYEDSNQYVDWYSKTANDYLRVNMGWPGTFEKEIRMTKNAQDFIAHNTSYLEIVSANLVLQMQYFFKLHGIEYIMCNTQHVWSPAYQLNLYFDFFDKSRYMDFYDNELCFYWKYKNLGYDNPKARYGHHALEAHTLYAEELYNFMQANSLIK